MHTEANTHSEMIFKWVIKLGILDSIYILKFQLQSGSAFLFCIDIGQHDDFAIKAFRACY
jgi:hypothetical protein